MGEDKPAFTPAQIAEMSAYYEVKTRSYERFLTCAIIVATGLSCLQVFVIAIVAAYFFGKV